MRDLSLNELFATEMTDEKIYNLWYDWFCKSTSIVNKGKRMLPKVKALMESRVINKDTTYIFFKNNCPCYGDCRLYDDFRFCDLETGEVLFTVIPRNPYGNAELWGRRDGKADTQFEKLFEGTWRDCKKFFLAL